MKQAIFSAVLYVDDADSLSSALDALKQCRRFPQEGEAVVVDPHNSAQVQALCEQVEWASYFPLPQGEAAQAYELGLSCARGKYLCFTLASARYSPSFFAFGGQALDEGAPMAAAAACYQDLEGASIPYATSCKPEDAGQRIDLIQQPRKVQLMLQACLFPAQRLQGMHFQTNLHDDALRLFLLDLQMEQPSYYALPTEAEYRFTVPLEDVVSPNTLQLCPWWYEDSVRQFILPLLSRRRPAPPFVQRACYYLLYSKLNCNLNARTKGTIQGREAAEQFWQMIDQASALLDDEIIMTRWPVNYAPIGRALRFYLLRRKARHLGLEVRVWEDGKAFRASLLYSHGSQSSVSASLGPVKDEALRVRVINCQKDRLVIDADVLLGEFLPTEDYQVWAVSAGADVKHICPAQSQDTYPLIKYFGYTCMRRHTVQFSIPIICTARQKISFHYRWQGKEYRLRLVFSGVNARLRENMEYSYWMCQKNLALLCGKKNTLVLRRVGLRFRISRELRYQREMKEKEKDPALLRDGLRLRRLYWLLLPLWGREQSWVTFDKLYKAGDNGEYMFQYLRRTHPEIHAYYILEEDSPDYQRLSRKYKGNILIYGTTTCTLRALLSRVMLSTHTDTPLRFDPQKRLLPYYKDLMGYRTVCIQHGLTIQKIAQYQNRLLDNTELYCLASPYELKNVSHPVYGYSPSALKLTGLARYDGLVNHDQHMILITPSWRRNVTVASVGGIRHPKNEQFRQSDYFQIYNRLINDPDLIECAKRTGYRIVYLLHPALTAQRDDFDCPDGVELVSAVGEMTYEKMLTQASLMVTDYSGVQFDFAYMRKPIVYYHPDALPPHYESGGMDYATMGFGPICSRHDQLVDCLCQAMKNGCQTAPEYLRRADDFFTFNDHNNCQRIYQAVTDWLDERK